MQNLRRLLDALLCFKRVVVPTALCFSSDSYAGSVIRRSTDEAGSARSHSTASWLDSSNKGVFTGRVILRDGQVGLSLDEMTG